MDRAVPPRGDATDQQFQIPWHGDQLVDRMQRGAYLTTRPVLLRHWTLPRFVTPSRQRVAAHTDGEASPQSILWTSQGTADNSGPGVSAGLSWGFSVAGARIRQMLDLADLFDDAGHTGDAFR